MLRTLLTPRWLGGLAVAAIFAVTAVLLGNWQYSRHEDRVAWRDQVEAHRDGDPVALADLVGNGRVDAAQQWQSAVLTGHYLPEQQLLVRNRPHHGVFGYEVLVPVVADTGETLLVNRGWVPNAPTADMEPDVPPAPGEDIEVSLTGWLRVGEEDLGRDLTAGQLASIDIARATDQTGLDLVDGYLVLDTEQRSDGLGSQRPEPLEPPRTDLGSHFAYALQWWLTSPLGFVMVVVFARRDHRDAQGETEQRPRKVRIWDEEDE